MDKQNGDFVVKTRRFMVRLSAEVLRTMRQLVASVIDIVADYRR